MRICQICNRICPNDVVIPHGPTGKFLCKKCRKDFSRAIYQEANADYYDYLKKRRK